MLIFTFSHILCKVCSHTALLSLHICLLWDFLNLSSCNCFPNIFHVLCINLLLASCINILFAIFLVQVFRQRTPEDAINLVSRLLEYTPSARITPLQACAHKFFDELRDPNTRLPNNRELPPLYNFTEQGECWVWHCLDLNIKAVTFQGDFESWDGHITLTHMTPHLQGKIHAR